MIIGISIFLVVLFFITLYLTLRVLKVEEEKMKKYEEEGDTVEDQLKRSHEYETQSLRKNIPIQIWFYVGMFIVFTIAFVIYLKIMH